MLAFDEAKHEYRWKGAVVPGVTSVLEPLYDWLKEIPSHVLERKAAIGRETHIACDLLDKDDLDWDSLDPVVKPYVDSYIGWLDLARPTLLAGEQKVYHPVHRYAGQFDRLFLIDGVKWDTDLKTTSVISRGVGVQTAAYQAARGDAKPEDMRGALQLLATGKPAKLHPFTDRDDFPIFLSLLNLNRWRHKHGS